MRANPYETDLLLGQYLLFHYGRVEEVLPWPNGPIDALNFPIRCVQECLDLGRLPAGAQALDLGCAVGRSSFELARHCAAVRGVDSSHRFIAAAKRLQKYGRLVYDYCEEGEVTSRSVAIVPAGIDRRRVQFEVGDAINLRPDLGRFDVVLMANLLDRLYDPLQCLRRLPTLVRPLGQLIITSPWTWLEEYTPRKHWLGGFRTGRQGIRSADRLSRALASHFDLLSRYEQPFLIREHSRKYQWSVASTSVWVRRED